MGHSRNPSASTPEAAVDPQHRKDSSFLSSAPAEASPDVRFSDLRGVRWRTNLGILPPSSSSTDEFRRVAADSRRSYAALRRRVLVDPHLIKGGKRFNDLSMDNPLSQNPDSPWVQLFQNAELGKKLDQDLSRLYPDQGGYFQTSSCQAMLRTILLLWCVKHPECGYRQGMHELLAPLLYVLHADLTGLSELQNFFEDYFVDDTSQILEREPPSHKLTGKRYHDDGEDELHDLKRSMQQHSSGLSGVDPDVWRVVLSSEPYGAEGELGAVLSERFMEHDGYCMFDSLMSGSHGVVAMVDFFSPHIGPIPSAFPIVEGSAALYHILSFANPSLHDHLVGLGIEPQYFALRWLRVLFAREFSLDNLLLIWDHIFSASNSSDSLDMENNGHPSFRLLSSPRGKFISSMAVSMLLHLRSSLLATENATSCLQKLLNFPENTHASKLIDMTKTLQDFLAAGISTSSSPFDGDKNSTGMGFSPSHNSFSSKTHLHAMTENYWEEKWRVLNQEKELQEENRHDLISGFAKRFHSARLSLSGLEAMTSPFRNGTVGNDPLSFVRRRSLDDLTKEDSFACLGQVVHENIKSDAKLFGLDKMKSGEFADFVGDSSGGVNSKQSGKNVCLSVNTTATETEPPCANSIQNCDSENCFPNSSNGEKREVVTSTWNSSGIPRANLHKASAENLGKPPSTEADYKENRTPSPKERRAVPLKFPWPWKFNRNTNGRNLGKGGSLSPRRLSFFVNTQKNNLGSSVHEEHSSGNKLEVKCEKMTMNLKNLGQAVKEHVEILEKFFNQDQDQTRSSDNTSRHDAENIQTQAAASSLKELQRIGRLLSNM